MKATSHIWRWNYYRKFFKIFLRFKKTVFLPIRINLILNFRQNSASSRALKLGHQHSCSLPPFFLLCLDCSLEIKLGSDNGVRNDVLTIGEDLSGHLARRVNTLFLGINVENVFPQPIDTFLILRFDVFLEWKIRVALSWFFAT